MYIKETLTHSSMSDRNFLGEYRMYTLCPMCQERINSLDFITHMVNEHPLFFMVWASFNQHDFHTPENLLRQSDFEDSSYEFLSELCDTVGYHRVGVGDIDVFTTVVVADEKTCPICFDGIEVGRKINLCEHIFCDGCAQKWFSEHKTCPVCVRDITAEPQMLATSMSSSGSASSSSMNTT